MKQLLILEELRISKWPRYVSQKISVFKKKTTKRALRENVAITSQLKKMSSKTMDIIQENKVLAQKVSKLTSLNALMGQSEQELAKRNQSNQGVIKMLVEKLRGVFFFNLDNMSHPTQKVTRCWNLRLKRCQGTRRMNMAVHLI